MSKVEILRLDSVTTNDTTATASINANFQALQEAIDNTISRDGTVPNYMDSVLDLNSNRIINAADPVDPLDVVNLKYVQETLGNLTQYVTDAEAAAIAAQEKAQSAANSATSAAGSAQSATSSAQDAYTFKEEAKSYRDEIVPSNFQTVANLVTSISSESTDTKYPSAKCVYDAITGASPIQQQQADWSQTDSSAVDYIKNKPTINDSTITVTQNSGAITVGSFTLNQSSAGTIDLDNAIGFVTTSTAQTITGDKTFSGTLAVATPSLSDDTTKPVNTSYINDKFVVVSVLPLSPDPDVFYFIPEA